MNIQTLTVHHDPAEDRIVLFARQSDTEHVILLTRRLTIGLLGALSKQIKHTQGDLHLAQSGHQDALLAMKHTRALGQVQDAQLAGPVVFGILNRQPRRLLSEIEIRVHKGAMRLNFSDVNGVIACIAFDPAQIHWFVSRLMSHIRKAGWGHPIPVPVWLDQPSNPNLPPQNETLTVH